MTTPTQVGWIDERGILFPLSAYNPERASQYDAHKAGWEPVYKRPKGAQPVAPDTHAFKNFHRVLCERFSYCHDERDWRRDQVSLIEHIASHPMTGWQPIETAPKDGTLLVLGAKNGVWLGKYLPFYQSGFQPSNPWASMMLNHDHMAERYTRPTHWMPLPKAPARCQTCDDHGVIGGPSYYSPDEGGEPCPDCATSQPLPPAALAAARAFGTGLDPVSLEQGEPA